MSRRVLAVALAILVFASHPARPVAQNESDDAQRVRTAAKAFGLGKTTGIAISRDPVGTWRAALDRYSR